MSIRTADPGTRHRQLSGRGFTTVEMMVAVVVAGLLGAAIFSLLLDQNRFYGQRSDRDYAEETLRASSELAATELRMASGGDVLAAEADSVAVWADVMAGYVCFVDASDEVYYYVYHTVSQPALAGSRGTAYSNPFAETFVYEPSFDATGSATTAAKDACEGYGAPKNKASQRYRSVAWSGTPPEPGAVLRIYRKLSYYFAPSAISDGLALWRNASELAGPFASGNVGFRYRVCTSSSSCSWHTSVTDASDQRNIRRIVLEGRAIGDAGTNRYGVTMDLDYDITLRNYIQN